MKQYIVRVLVLIVGSFVLTPTFAAKPSDLIIVDAGSSHSELYVYHMEPQPKSLPVMTLTYHVKTYIALSEQVNNPSGIAEWVLTLTKDLPTQIAANTPMYVMGTGGMRQLTADQQKNIYAAVAAEIQNQTHFKTEFVGTITGQREGIYGWLSVNYLSNHLSKGTPTVGVLDMGGASTQITFASSKLKSSPDVIQLELGPLHYQLFSHSFLGLGHNEAMKLAANAACYPTNTPLNDGGFAQFNFEACATSSDVLLKSAEVASTIPDVKGQTFMALSGFYYTFDFFKSLSQPQSLKNEIQIACSQPWPAFQSEHPDVAETFLKSFCFNGIYDYELLTKGYHHFLTQNTIQPVNKIQNQVFGWTLGAALYEYLNP